MFLSVVAKYLKLTWHVKKLTILSELQYPFSFFLQIFAMIFNEGSLVFVWMIFFNKFQSINGWTFQSTLILLSIAWAAIILIAILFGGIFELSQKITNGELDYYLTSPVSALWQISVSKTLVADIGTIILIAFMLGYSGIAFTLTNIFLLLLLVSLSTIVMFSFIVIVHSLPFYISQSESISEQFVRSLFHILYYPQSIFTFPFKIITTFIIPTFFVGTLPMQILQNFDLIDLYALIAFTILIVFVAYKVFKCGLERYESGNLITFKM